MDDAGEFARPAPVINPRRRPTAVRAAHAILVGFSTQIAIGTLLLVTPLASDGLFDNLFPDEIVETIRSGPLDNSVGTLVEAAQGRMATGGGTAPSKPDDLTVIAYRPR